MAFKMEDEEAASIARMREAFANRADAFNELRHARLGSAESHLRSLDMRADAEQAAAATALESGNWDEHAKRQRNMAELEVQRSRAENAKRYFENQPMHPRDPVEALIASKSSEPETQAWLRAHPTDALALATGSDPRRQAKILASHADAIADGHTPGSNQYFEHVDRYLGGNKPTDGTRQVRVVKAGQAAHGDDEMTRGEYEAATSTLTWGYEGGDKRGQPIGVKEYLRRRDAMRKQSGWYDKLD
jgi:hypothetical protein